MNNKNYFYTTIFLLTFFLTACGGSTGTEETPVTNYRIETALGAGGTISPEAITVNEGETASFTITPDSGFTIASVSGCNGSLSGNTYTTGVISSNCTVSVNFIDESTTRFTVTATAGIGGSITPMTTLVAEGSTTQFTITPENNFEIDTVSGCSGTLNGNIYTTAAITADCSVSVSFIGLQAPIVNAGVDQIVDELTTVTMTGSANDNDGTVVSFLWVQTAGTTVTLNNSGTEIASFDAPDVINSEVLGFQLQATDNDGLVGTDDIEITINPVANSGVKIVAATGMPATGFPDGYVYWSVSDAVIGDSGHIAFAGAADTSVRETSQNTKALWAGLPNDLNVILKENDTLPGLASNVLYNGSFSQTNTIMPAVIVNSTGDIASNIALKGAVNENNDQALVVYENNQLHLVVRNGDPVDGLPVGTSYGRLLNYAFSEAGLVYSAEIIHSSGQFGLGFGYGLWLWDFNETRLVALTDLSRNSALFDVDQESPNIDSGRCRFASLALSDVQLNNQGDILFDALVSASGTDTCQYESPLLKWNDGGFTVIVDHDQAVPALSGYSFNRTSSLITLNDTALYENGDVGLHSLIWQNFSDPRSLHWVKKSNGESEYLALGGELLPEGSLFLANNLGVFGLAPLVDGNERYLVNAYDSKNPSFFQSDAYLLAGHSRPIPYSTIDEVGATTLSTLFKTGDVPPDFPATAYFSRIYSNFGFVPTMNENGNITFFAEREDALDPNLQTIGLWHIDNNGEVKKLLEIGDTIPFNGENIGVTQLGLGTGFAQRLSLTGGASLHSNTGDILLAGQLSNAFQALFFITP